MQGIFDTLRGTYQNLKDIQDVKTETRRYMEMLEDLVPNKYKHDGIEYYFKPNVHLPQLEYDYEIHNKPSSLLTNQDLQYWENEFRKLGMSEDSNFYGQDCYSPSAYFFYKFRKVKPEQGPAFHATFRRFQAQLFGITDSMMFSKPNYWDSSSEYKDAKGMIFIGPRQSGKSEFFGAKQYHTALVKNNIDMHYNAHRESASKKYLENKVKIPSTYLPHSLKLTMEVDNILKIKYGKKAKKSKGGVMYGKNNIITVSAPSEKMIDGDTLYLWVCDEGPVVPDFESVFTSTKNTIWNPYRPKNRWGYFLTGGVAGEFDDENVGFMNVWDNADLLDMVRIFIPGWVSIPEFTDEFGNEDVEKAVYHILKNRLIARKTTPAKYLNEISSFPLTIDEAKQSTSSNIGFSRDKINSQIRVLENHSYRIRKGMWVGDIHSEPMWEEDQGGKTIMIEMPNPKAEYLAGVDAYDIKTQVKGSEGATTIYKEPSLISPDKQRYLIDQVKAELGQESLDAALELGGLPVLLYADNNPNPEIFARNSYLAQKAFRAKGAVERKPSLIFNWYAKMGLLEDWVFHRFVKAEDVREFIEKYIYGDKELQYGQIIDEDWKAQRTLSLSNYFSLYSYLIFIRQLLVKGLTYNPNSKTKKGDAIDSFGLAKMYSEQKDLIKSIEGKNYKKESFIGVGGFKQNADGIYIRT